MTSPGVPAATAPARTAPAVRWAHLAEVRFGGVVAALFLLAAVTHALALGTTVATTTSALVVAAGAVALRPGAALVAGLAGWACVTGLVVNGYGVLSFGSGDLARAGLLIGVAVLGSEVRRAA